MDAKKNNKRESFSKEIDHVVVLSFGIAFFVIYTASAILLYITEENTARYYGKAIGMFLAFLALYIIASVLVTRKIRLLFGPLDDVAYALIGEKRLADSPGTDIKSLADSLQAQSEQVDALSKELESTQNNLDDANLESRQNRSQQMEMSQQLIENLEEMQEHQEQMQLNGYKMASLLKMTQPLEDEIKEIRESLYDQMQQIDDNIQNSVRQHEDTATDFTELGGTFELLGNMQSDAEELLDNIYNEMTSLQSLSGQVNLYAMNTALDISRAGSITMSAISALDEIKELTGTIGSKTDDVLLLLIRTRNALKLAMDQSGECKDKGEECSKAFENSRIALGEQKEAIQQMLSATDTLTEDVTKLAGALNEVSLLVEQQNSDQSKAKEGMDVLQTDLEQWTRNTGSEES